MRRLSRCTGLAVLILGTLRCGGGSDLTNPPPGGSGSVASIRVEPATTTIDAGQNATFQATLLDASGHALEGRAAPVWTSSDPAIAAVDPNVPGGQGNPISVKGIGGGTATITATSEGKSGTAQLTVNAPRLLTGRVFDAVAFVSIPNAAVTFFGPNNENLGTVVTGADGSFTSPPLAVDQVTVGALATGYVQSTMFGVVVPEAAASTNIGEIPLVPQSQSPGGISGTVRNARDPAQGIEGAVVSLFEGLGPASVNDDRFLRFTNADASGAFSFSGAAAGTYTLVVQAPGFNDATRNGIAVGNTVTSGQDVILSPAGANDIRIVLTWGPTPSDLDAHLTGPGFHVYYSSRGSFDAAPFAGLDVDDVSSFGPETVTITQLNGVYRFSVHDFTDRNESSSTALAQSGAQVKVYTTQGLAQTFNVPNQGGNLWAVFTLSGAIDNPTITALNEVTDVSDPAAVQDKGRVPDAALIGSAARTHPKARSR